MSCDNCGRPDSAMNLSGECACEFEPGGAYYSEAAAHLRDSRPYSAPEPDPSFIPGPSGADGTFGGDEYD